MQKGVLSFDCGLRTLAVALVEPKHAKFPAEVVAQASREEGASAWRERVLVWFLSDGWVLRHGEVLDVTAAVEGGVKDVRHMSPPVVAAALHATLSSLEEVVAAAGGYSTVAVETQHNANALMRSVCLGVFMHYVCARGPTVKMEAVSGGQKLKLCEVLGVPPGAGIKYLEDRRAAAAAAAAEKKSRGRRGGKPAAAAPVEPVAPVELDEEELDEEELDEDRTLEAAAAATVKGYTWKRGGPRFQGRRKDDSRYLDNKFRAVLATGRLGGGGGGSVANHNLADALLQGLWVLWQQTCPAAPRKRAAVRPAGKPRASTSSKVGVTAVPLP